MSNSEVIDLGEFGKVTVVELGSNTTKICANIVNYTEVCLTLEVKPLTQEAEKIVKELFEKYRKIVIDGFVKGLQYAMTMVEVEKRAEKSIVYT
jgi:adenylate kinase